MRAQIDATLLIDCGCVCWRMEAVIWLMMCIVSFGIDAVIWLWMCMFLYRKNVIWLWKRLILFGYECVCWLDYVLGRSQVRYSVEVT